MSSRIQSSNLARLVVRAFFDDIHAVVLESVIRKDVSGIKTSELAEGLKLDNSSVQTALKDLRRNGIIVDRSKK